MPHAATISLIRWTVQAQRTPQQNKHKQQLPDTQKAITGCSAGMEGLVALLSSWSLSCGFEYLVNYHDLKLQANYLTLAPTLLNGRRRRSCLFGSLDYAVIYRDLRRKANTLLLLQHSPGTDPVCLETLIIR
jgi:hypothetical protein